MKLRQGLEMIGDDFHHIPSHLNEDLFFIDCAVSGTHHLRSAAYDQWRHGGGGTNTSKRKRLGFPEVSQLIAKAV